MRDFSWRLPDPHDDAMIKDFHFYIAPMRTGNSEISDLFQFAHSS